MSKRSKKDEDSGSHVDAGTTLVLEYLEKQGRPYSAADVSTNLHNKVTKAHAVKALRELHKNKQIESRVAGKQIVYHALQSAPNSTPDTIAAEESIATQIQEQIDKLKASERKTRAELTACCSKPLLSELREEIEKLRQEVASITAQLARIRASNPPEPGSCRADSSVGLDLEWKRWRDRVAVRRRICRALWDRCTEVLPGDTSRGELWDSLGMEGAPFE